MKGWVQKLWHVHTTLKARVVDSLLFVDRDELSNKLQHVLESYWVVILAEHFFLFSLIFLFLQKWPFSFQKKHFKTLNKQFSRFSSNFLLQNSQIAPPKQSLLRLLRGPMKSTKKLESQSHSVYTSCTLSMDVFKTFFFFLFPLGVFLFGGFEVSCFLLPGQLPTLPLLFMHFLCLYLKVFIHVIHSMLKEYRRKYMCLSPYGSWSWTWITSKTKKAKRKKTFVCQLSLTKRLVYPINRSSFKESGHFPTTQLCHTTEHSCA